MSNLHNIVVGALRNCIYAHGSIDKEWVGSAAKRIVNAIEKNSWQPITTAPQDGTEILVYGRFCSELSEAGEDGKIISKVYWATNQWEVCDTTYYACWVLEPTHWQPLPEPPQETA